MTKLLQKGYIDNALSEPRGFSIKLARKHRPGRFDDVIGQDVPVRVLKTIVAEKRYRAAYMFEGPAGTGKTTLGRIFANALLCESPQDGNPCLSCESCKLFREEKHFSYNEIDAASVSGKDDMVHLRDGAEFQPMGNVRILFLDEAQDISKQGFNALLKQLEECPEHLIYIFSTTEPERITSTVRDRCMEFQISRVDPTLVVGRIKHVCDEEGIEYDEDALVYISEACEGHVRNAINMVEDISYLGKVTLERAKELSRAFDEEVCTLICNLGMNLQECLTAAKGVTSKVSVLELYQQTIAMLNDTAKFIYGHDDLLTDRKHYVERIKDIHGYKVMEFLSYLVKRDKFVDRVGLQSDIVLLHYKFLSNSFIPKENQPAKVVTPQEETHTTSQGTETPSAPSQQITYTDLSKLGIEERSKVLRQSRQAKKSSGDEETNTETVPTNWPLPKDPRVGENNPEDPELSPEAFSRLMVGGRGGGI